MCPNCEKKLSIECIKIYEKYDLSQLANNILYTFLNLKGFSKRILQRWCSRKHQESTYPRRQQLH